MKSNSPIFYLLLFGVLWLASGCATITGFSTGRTVGKGKTEIRGTASLIETPDLVINDTLEIIPTLRLPLLEVGVRYGLGEQFDLGLKINTAANFALDARYQFVGDQESIVAVAAGAEIGVLPLTGIGITIINFQIPLYFSVHPTEKIHIYASPRYAYQYGTQVSRFIGNANYTGINAGVLFGRDFKFGIDVANYRVFGNGGRLGREYEKPNLLNFGLGMFFTF